MKRLDILKEIRDLRAVSNNPYYVKVMDDLIAEEEAVEAWMSKVSGPDWFWGKEKEDEEELMGR